MVGKAASPPLPPGTPAYTVGSVPIPDPTQRTVDQLHREVQATRQIIESTGRGIREVLETRLDGVEKTISMLQSLVDRGPQRTEMAISQMRELYGEKFHSIEIQITARFDGIDRRFLERDRRVDLLSAADKAAISASLHSQQEATSKMEANFLSMIGQTQQAQQEFRRTTDDKINDVKSRLDKGEGVQRGSYDTRTEGRLDSGHIISYIVAGVAVIGLLVTLLSPGNRGSTTVVSPAVVPSGPRP